MYSKKHQSLNLYCFEQQGIKLVISRTVTTQNGQKSYEKYSKKCISWVVHIALACLLINIKYRSLTLPTLMVVKYCGFTIHWWFISNFNLVGQPLNGQYSNKSWCSSSNSYHLSQFYKQEMATYMVNIF